MTEHPAQWSSEVLDVIAPWLTALRLPVHDPFAGTGVRLAELCARLGLDYTGTDIERWPGRDERVEWGDSTCWWWYPERPHVIVTSPTYANRMADYPDGPLPTTKLRMRRSYGIALGRALDPRNSGRLGPRRLAEYEELHAEAVQWWGEWVVLNIDSTPSLVEVWLRLLSGYSIKACERIETRRYRGPANSDVRQPYELAYLMRKDGVH